MSWDNTPQTQGQENYVDVMGQYTTNPGAGELCGYHRTIHHKHRSRRIMLMSWDNAPQTQGQERTWCKWSLRIHSTWGGDGEGKGMRRRIMQMSWDNPPQTLGRENYVDVMGQSTTNTGAGTYLVRMESENKQHPGWGGGGRGMRKRIMLMSRDNTPQTQGQENYVDVMGQYTTNPGAGELCRCHGTIHHKHRGRRIM